MSKLSICHASLLESYLSVKLAICQSYLFVMLATCHSYMSKQLAHLVPVLRKFLVKLPLIRAPQLGLFLHPYRKPVGIPYEKKKRASYEIPMGFLWVSFRFPIGFL